MKKELYLYSGIYDFTAERIISALNENPDDDVVMRINSPGGGVLAGWGIIAKMQERKGKVHVKIDGGAMSMAAMISLFADHVEALDVSTIMLHRAIGYADTQEQKDWLNRINKDLRAKIETKVDAEQFEKVTGYKVADLFEKEERLDLFLSAKQAKQIGIVDSIVKADPDQIKAVAQMFDVAAQVTQIDNSKNIIMTKEDFKLKHPEAYNALVAEVKTAVLAEESDRVGSWMVFIDTDKKAVLDGIASGKAISATQMSEFVIKKTAQASLATLDEEGKGTPAAEQSEAAKKATEAGAKKTEAQMLEEETMSLLGVKK